MTFRKLNVPAVEPLEKSWKSALLLCLLVYLVAVGVRAIDYPKWDVPQLEINGEYLMGTHDAYFWMAGAEKIGAATNHPLAIGLDVVSRISGLSVGDLAFWAPGFLAPLVAVLAFMWGRLLAGNAGGIFAGLFSSLAQTFYFRTRLGYYDTDVVTLFFPLLLSLGMAVWIQPQLRIPWVGNDQDEADEDERLPSLGFMTALGALAAFGSWFHNGVPQFSGMLFWLAAAVAGFLVKKEIRLRCLYALGLFALAAHGGWIGLFAALVLYGFSKWFPEKSKVVETNLWVVAGLLLVAVAWGGMVVQLADSVFSRIRDYLGYSTQMTATSGNTSIEFPSITQSVVEAQTVPLKEVFGRVMPYMSLAFLGIAGFLVLLVLRPETIFMLPLIALCVASVKMGARFGMFGIVPISLGLSVPLVWLLESFLPEERWKKWAMYAAPSAFALVLLSGWINLYVQIPPTPVLIKPHAEALSQLYNFSPPNSWIWTWWDWGYASDYYAKRKSYADGGRHSGSRVFAPGLALSSPSPLQSNQIMRYCAVVGGDPGNIWKERSPEEVQSFVAGLAHQKLELPKVPKQYLVVTWENFRIIHWISYYGSWNFVTKTGYHAKSLLEQGEFNFDTKTGTVTKKGQEPYKVRSINLLTDKGTVVHKYEQNEGPHFLYNYYFQEAYLMDDMAYNSMMVQLLLADIGDKRFSDQFTLSWNGYPAVRIYEVVQN